MKKIIGKQFLVFALIWVPGLSLAQTPVSTTTEQLQSYYGLLEEYCVSCHNWIDQTPDGRPLLLDEMSLDNLGANLEEWERVVRRLSAGQMPPQGQPHPNPEALQDFKNWLVASLDALGEVRNDPGEFALRRLNRTEYANAIRDIFGIEIDIAQYLPPDSSDAGFDNVATALTITPALMDRYLTTAVQVSTMIAGDPQSEATEVSFPVRKDFNQNHYVPGLPLGTRGGTVVTYNFPADGFYRLSAMLIRSVDSADMGLEGQIRPHTFEILIDGNVIHSSQMGGPEDHALSVQNITLARDRVGERMMTEVFVTAGPHDVGFTFVERPDLVQDVYKPALRSSQDIHASSGYPAISSAKITGPFNPSGVSENPVYNALFICQPGMGIAEEACAEQILERVARLAYRRPLTEEDMEPIMDFYLTGREIEDFETGIRTALTRILTSPSFLLRVEFDPEGMAPGTTHDITDLELASRLSFFLWSSVPDEELLTLAEANQLRDPAVLQQQVRRMLADERSRALTTNFPDQWLALRNLDNVAPDLLDYPEWGYNLRQAAQDETRLFFDSLIRENRSVLDLLTADYTFMNERLAVHYGVPGIYGTAFQRVELDDPNRFGLLGQASVLSLTSIATRTSPVLRGKWVLTNLIGTPPLPPPDDVDTALNEDPGTAPMTLRERLERHREDPVCNSCHRNMDPIGFALENFNVVGKWRNVEMSGMSVDSAGVLSDGTPVDSPRALSQAILNRPDVFVGLVTEKLMTYALGRGIGAEDMPMVREVVRNSAVDDYRFMTLIQEIVKSPAFQQRQKPVAGKDGLNVAFQ
jgi:hypothetical protein